MKIEIQRQEEDMTWKEVLHDQLGAQALAYVSVAAIGLERGACYSKGELNDTTLQRFTLDHLRTTLSILKEYRGYGNMHEWNEHATGVASNVRPYMQ